MMTRRAGGASVGGGAGMRRLLADRRRGRKLTALVVLCSFLFHISPLPALASVAGRRAPTPRVEAFHAASNIQQ
ncbi:MAG: hypothetical protein IJR14_05495, partial [Synergistaceae bacterium]|nr:hypothetical protein [Synergistaceae bacterium]